MQKNTDRVGLLHSRTEDEDIVSDQETEVVAMSGVKPKVINRRCVCAGYDVLQKTGKNDLVNALTLFLTLTMTVSQVWKLQVSSYLKVHHL